MISEPVNHHRPIYNGLFIHKELINASCRQIWQLPPWPLPPLYLYYVHNKWTLCYAWNRSLYRWAAWSLYLWLAWLTDSLTDSLTHWLTDWRTHWLTDWLTHSLTDLLTHWLTDSLTNWLTYAPKPLIIYFLNSSKKNNNENMNH